MLVRRTEMQLFTTAYVTHVTHDVTEEVAIATASSSGSDVDCYIIITKSLDLVLNMRWDLQNSILSSH
jgi:hypothetical protein